MEEQKEKKIMNERNGRLLHGIHKILKVHVRGLFFRIHRGKRGGEKNSYIIFL
jgi:hypothetical protein